ncbi:MAG: M66 family metalloprotease [Gemmatimonadota bacterium]
MSGMKRGIGWLVLAAAVALGCGGGSTAVTTPAGRIEFEVSGLPVGAVPRLAVVGPDHGVHTVGAATELNGLAPGQYTVSALHVSYGTDDYTGTVLPSVVTVSNDLAATTAVTYAGQTRPTVDFTIPSIRLFQSVQNAGDNVPMVANRAVFVQIYGVANQGNSTLVKVRVHLYHNGILTDSLTLAGPSAVPTSADPGSLTASWNFIIPAIKVTAGLSLDAVIDPDDQFGEASEINNRFTVSAQPFAPTIVTVPTVKVTLVPVHQSSGSGTVTTGTAGNYTDLARDLYPISTLTTSVRAAFTTQAPVLQSNDDNGAWGQILSEINALRVSDHSPATYYGVVHPGYNSGIAGLGYVGLPAAIGWDKGSGVGGVAAHELGHTFGRQHAPCGGPSGVDGSYPYANASIGVWGYDQSANQLKDPSTTVDLMSYCSPDWISDYTYLGVLSHLMASSSVHSDESVPALLVWGRIVGDSLILEPAFQVDAPARLPAATGPYRVTGTAVDGSTTFDLSFAGDLVPDLPRVQRHFAFVIPLSQARSAALASIRLAGPSRRAVQATSLVTTIEAEVSRVSSDQVQVRWDARYPMAVVRDRSTGQIIAFGRGGSTNVTTTTDVRVDLSRGTHSEPALIRKRK